MCSKKTLRKIILKKKKKSQSHLFHCGTARVTRKFKINRGARLTVQRRSRENTPKYAGVEKIKLINGRIRDKTANGWCFAASGSIAALVSGHRFPGVSGADWLLK